MSTVKCNLFKPVDNTTGTFFMFSQYALDLTKQNAQTDAYRCVPSKYVACNLKFENSEFSGTDSQNAQKLGKIFQNYFENACTLLRQAATLEHEWNPEYTRTLLFQTLEKHKLIEATRDIQIDHGENVLSSETVSIGAVNSGISDQIQYIGDINICSYDDTGDGVGYNEIYVYIPNEAKATDYQISSAYTTYPTAAASTYISGYSESDTAYNGLDYAAIYDTEDGNGIYAVGRYDTGLTKYSLVPDCLKSENANINENPNDTIRLENDEPLESFDINAIIVLYDIVYKNMESGEYEKYYNIPLGIYLTGKPITSGETINLTNIITKYVSNDEIYNQGTSYGLRICTRYLATPNSTEIIESTATGTIISEVAPLLDRMNDTIDAADALLKRDTNIYDILDEHLALFKNNKTNVPYVRQLGPRKYWFVNGKNTGAVAEFEFNGTESIINSVLARMLEISYTKEQMANILANYMSADALNEKLSEYYNKADIDEKFAELEDRLKIHILGEPEEN